MYQTKISIFIVGALLYASQLFSQQLMAIQFGISQGTVASLLIISLASAMLGAWVKSIPTWIPALTLSVLYLTPTPMILAQSSHFIGLLALIISTQFLLANWLAHIL